MRRLALFAAALASIAATRAAAHDARPLFISLSESPAGVELVSAAPAAIEVTEAPRVTLAAPCAELARNDDDPWRQRALYDCKAAGAVIRIEWPLYNPSVSTLVRVSFANGETRSVVLDPSQTEWRAPAPENFGGVARSYLALGVHHILGGIDHLLFVAGLLMIARTPRRTLVTVTGFTIAHSITLALVALGVMRISVPATEAVIALSIVFLATEIARGDRTTLAWRRPVLVASAFGLVHGAGFAAALGEVGLPKTETLAALLFFNVGVEAGQLAVIAATFLAGFAARTAGAASLSDLRPAERVAAYAIGIVSAYWFTSRLAAIFTA